MTARISLIRGKTRGHRPRLQSFIFFVQGLPARKTGLDIVPVLDAVLTQLPTEVDHPAILYIWKVAESLFGVFEQHTQILDLVDERRQVGDRFHIFHTELAEPIERSAIPGFLNFGIQPADVLPFLTDFGQDSPQPWKQTLRFTDCKDSLVHLF